MSSPTAHALLSASSSHRWLECTAAPRFEAQFEAQETSVYAEEGTLAHEVCEITGKSRFKLIGSDEYNTAMDKAESNPLFKLEMIRTAEIYADYLSDKATGMGADPSVLFEQRVDFSEYVPDGFGTCDCVIISGDRMHIADYKHGKGVAVEAKGNPQMRLYALGALEMFGALYDIKTVSMGICQPRLHEDVEEDEISAEDLVKWGLEYVKPRARKAYDGAGDFSAGSHCRFCRGRALCRARAEAATHFEANSRTPFEKLTDGELSDLIKRAEWLKSWYDDLTDYALNAMICGKKIDGYKLVEGRSVRTFDDYDAALDDIEKAGWEQEMLYTRKPKTLTELESMIGKKRFAEIVGRHIVKPMGKPTLAESSDKRKEYSTAAADFSGIV